KKLWAHRGAPLALTPDFILVGEAIGSSRAIHAVVRRTGNSRKLWEGVGRLEGVLAVARNVLYMNFVDSAELVAITLDGDSRWSWSLPKSFSGGLGTLAVLPGRLFGRTRHGYTLCL